MRCQQRVAMTWVLMPVTHLVDVPAHGVHYVQSTACGVAKWSRIIRRHFAGRLSHARRNSLARDPCGVEALITLPCGLTGFEQQTADSLLAVYLSIDYCLS